MICASTAPGARPITVRRPTFGTSTWPRSFTGRSPDWSTVSQVRRRITSPGSTRHRLSPRTVGCTVGAMGTAGTQPTRNIENAIAPCQNAVRANRRRAVWRAGISGRGCITNGGKNRAGGPASGVDRWSKRPAHAENGWNGTKQKYKVAPHRPSIDVVLLELDDGVEACDLISPAHLPGAGDAR